jgi:FMN reductase
VTSPALATTVVVGNPKANSRTLAAAVELGHILSVAAAGAEPAAQPGVVDLSALGPYLFSWGHPEVAAAVATVMSADLLVVASPTYKAAPTGLLKAFLDQFAHDALAGRATVPVMVGGAPDHALAVETQLRPVLIEIGGSCPTRGLYLLESDLGDLPGALASWLPVNLPPLAAVARAAAQRRAAGL